MNATSLPAAARRKPGPCTRRRYPHAAGSPTRRSNQTYKAKNMNPRHFSISATVLFLALLAAGCGNKTTDTTALVLQSPEAMYGQLFYDVMQTDSLFGPGRLFADSKEFLDCTPKQDTDGILRAYEAQRPKGATQLAAFVKAHFALPEDEATAFGDSSDIDLHIRKLWTVLRRSSNDLPHQGTLIPLRHSYIVPGGRFREIYYWDSYFTMLGLIADGKTELAEEMTANFADLITLVGFVPNGNRTYYLSRSQPPFFAYMVDAMAESKNDSTMYTRYLPQLQAEYDFWMAGRESLSAANPASLHCVRMPDGEILNRYCDRLDTPREEMYRNDMETARRLQALHHPSSATHHPSPTTPHPSPITHHALFRHLRSAAESGWDFSSRWLTDERNLHTIHTTDFVAVDLNALLCHLEQTLAKAYALKGDRRQADFYARQAGRRKTAIGKYCWDGQRGAFFDYDISRRERSRHLTAATAFPLFTAIATRQQAERTAAVIRQQLLRRGGIVTTNVKSGQQWDAPNGWAPLQWITFRGLLNYGMQADAETLRQRWTGMVEQVYARTHKLLEKYDVVNVSDTGGGEYQNQDGFGWTNGVYRAMKTCNIGSGK